MIHNEYIVESYKYVCMFRSAKEMYIKIENRLLTLIYIILLLIKYYYSFTKKYLEEDVKILKYNNTSFVIIFWTSLDFLF